jgi:hypothetical protein
MTVTEAFPTRHTRLRNILYERELQKEAVYIFLSFSDIFGRPKLHQNQIENKSVVEKQKAKLKS